jgi:hypothetical protein
MKQLNDDELNSVLRQAKANSPKPSPGFEDRVTRAYRNHLDRSPLWRYLVFGMIRVPAPVGIVAALALLLAGVQLGRELNQPRTIQVPVIQERVVTKLIYRDRPTLNLYGFEPVMDLHPRIIRSAHENR